MNRSRSLSSILAKESEWAEVTFVTYFSTGKRSEFNQHLCSYNYHRVLWLPKCICTLKKETENHYYCWEKINNLSITLLFCFFNSISFTYSEIATLQPLGFGKFIHTQVLQDLTRQKPWLPGGSCCHSRQPPQGKTVLI